MVFGVGGAAGGEAGGHAGAADGIPGDGFVDDAVARLHGSLNERPVDLFDGPGGKLGGEGAMRGIVAGGEQDAASSGIEAVDNAGAEFAAETREGTEVVEQRIDEGAAGAARAGVDDEARRLVDGDDIGVFVEDFKGDRFGFGPQWLWRLGVYLNAFTAAEFVGGFARFAVHADAAPLNPLLETRAAEFGQGGRDGMVEPLAGLMRDDFDAGHSFPA